MTDHQLIDDARACVARNIDNPATRWGRLLTSLADALETATAELVRLRAIEEAAGDVMQQCDENPDGCPLCGSDEHHDVDRPCGRLWAANPGGPAPVSASPATAPEAERGAWIEYVLNRAGDYADACVERDDETVALAHLRAAVVAAVEGRDPREAR